MIKTIVTCDRCKKDFQTHDVHAQVVRSENASQSLTITFGLMKIEFIDTCPGCVEEIHGLVRAFRGEPKGAVKKSRGR